VAAAPTQPDFLKFSACVWSCVLQLVVIAGIAAGGTPVHCFRMSSASVVGLPDFRRKHVYCARNDSHSGARPPPVAAAVVDAVGAASASSFFPRRPHPTAPASSAQTTIARFIASPFMKRETTPKQRPMSPPTR